MSYEKLEPRSLDGWMDGWMDGTNFVTLSILSPGGGERSFCDLYVASHMSNGFVKAART